MLFLRENINVALHLRDLVKILLNELLLLYKLDVRQRISRQVNRLIEAVLTTIGNVDYFDDFRLQSLQG